MLKKVLTIAGSDSSGGAGIQADLKTIAAFGHYGMSAITALTAQNTLGVQGVLPTPPEFVAAQLESIFADITPDAIKVGMLGNAAIVRAVAAALRGHPGIPLVVDPVMISTSGHALLEADAVAALREELMPLATIVTPNMPEAAALTGRPVATAEEIRQAAEAVAARLPGVAVLVKGGHRADNSADDLLRTADGEMVQFRGERVDTRNTHGTGCTLSAAIACGLAEGWELAWAVQSAKEYLSGALRHDPHLGHGNGPLDHQWKMHG